MKKQELTPEEIAVKEAADKAAQEQAEKEAAEKAAQEQAAKEALDKAAKNEKVECMYCGKEVKADKAITDNTGKTFCKQEHADIYAQTMRRINNSY